MSASTSFHQPQPEPSKDVMPFDFNGHQVRVVTINGEPWFVASDVAKVLEYRGAANMTRMLDADEKGTHVVSTPGGSQKVSIISLSGLEKVYPGATRGRVPGLDDPL